MARPSAAHTGCDITRTPFVSWRAGPPSTGTIQRSSCSHFALLETKATARPSGDQVGPKRKSSWCIARSVSLRTAPPAAGTTHTSWCPERVDINARWRPSGDQRSWRSSSGPEVTRSGVPPAASTVQMSPPRRNASRRPSGDQTAPLPSVTGVRAPDTTSKSVTRAEPSPVTVPARRVPSGDHARSRTAGPPKMRSSESGMASCADSEPAPHRNTKSATPAAWRIMCGMRDNIRDASAA